MAANQLQQIATPYLILYIICVHLNKKSVRSCVLLSILLSTLLYTHCIHLGMRARYLQVFEYANCYMCDNVNYRSYTISRKHGRWLKRQKESERSRDSQGCPGRASFLKKAPPRGWGGGAKISDFIKILGYPLSSYLFSF